VPLAYKIKSGCPPTIAITTQNSNPHIFSNYF